MRKKSSKLRFLTNFLILSAWIWWILQIMIVKNVLDYVKTNNSLDSQIYVESSRFDKWKSFKNSRSLKFEQVKKIEQVKKLKKVKKSKTLVRFVRLGRCSSQLQLSSTVKMLVGLSVRPRASYGTSHLRILLKLCNYLGINILRILTEPFFRKKIRFLIKKIKRAFLGTLKNFKSTFLH